MRNLRVTDSIEINGANPLQVYNLVSDPTNMSRWSPENRRAIDPGGALVPGMFFDGINRRGPLRWTGRCRVLAAEPGVLFRFRTEKLGIPPIMVAYRIATWEYHLKEIDGGTRVTETWIDNRPWPDAFAAVVDPILTGSSSFAEFQRRNIATTLARLKADLES